MNTSLLHTAQINADIIEITKIVYKVNTNIYCQTCNKYCKKCLSVKVLMEVIRTITRIDFHMHTQICNFDSLGLHFSYFRMGERGAEYFSKRSANVLSLKITLYLSGVLFIF